MIPTFPGTQPGIDISKWQWGTPIDFQAVADYGVKFAIIRAGVSEHYQDPFLTQSVEGMRAVGVKVGAYHVHDPHINVDPAHQIANFADAISGLELKLGRLDCELPWTDVTHLRDSIYQVLMGMREQVSNTGVYTAPWYWNGPLNDRVLPRDPPGGDDDPLIRANGWSLWNADYGANNGQIPARMSILPAGWRPGDDGTGPHQSWQKWQYTNRGHVPGIANGVGNVDFNIMRDELFDEVWGEVEPPPPPPPDDLEERVEELELQVANIKLWGESFPT